MPKDYYIQPDPFDPVLSADQVLFCVRQHVPEVKAVTGVDESGGEARIYAIDSDLIFKTQRPQQLRPRTSLKKEVLFLKQLEGLEGLRVPTVIGYGHPEPMVEYTLMTRIPGVAVSNVQLAGNARVDALKSLGRMLRCMHSIPQAVLRESGLFFGDQSPVDVHWRIGSLFDDVTEKIKNERKTWNYPLPPEMIGRRLMATLPNVKDVVALHSNPGPEHTFIDPATGQLTGIIDFGDAYFSHPVNDLRRYRAPEDRDAVLAGYLESGPVSDDFMGVWRVGCAIADIVAIAFSPEHQPAASAELNNILEEVG